MNKLEHLVERCGGESNEWKVTLNRMSGLLTNQEKVEKGVIDTESNKEEKGIMHVEKGVEIKAE